MHSYLRQSIFVFAFIALTGCQQQPQSKLIGTWQIISAEELTERMTGETGEERLADSAIDEDSRSEFVAGKMEVEFATQNRLITRTTIMNSLSEKSGIWRIKKIEGDVTTIETVINGETATTDVQMLGEDKLSMIPPNINVLDEVFRFKRVK